MIFCFLTYHMLFSDVLSCMSFPNLSSLLLLITHFSDFSIFSLLYDSPTTASYFSSLFIFSCTLLLIFVFPHRTSPHFSSPLLHPAIAHIFTQIINIFLLQATSEDMPDFFKRGPGNERYVEVKHVLSPPLLEDAKVKSLTLIF